MQRSLVTRIGKLEAKTAGRQIVVWCDDPADFDAKVRQMVSGGKISEADTVYCVHWTRAKPAHGCHERALDELRL